MNLENSWEMWVNNLEKLESSLGLLVNSWVMLDCTWEKKVNIAEMKESSWGMLAASSWM